MKRMALVLILAVLALAAKRASFDPKLPKLGTKFQTLPAGKAKAAIETSCYPCHSADILVQQRLTEKQWTASIDKMVRWGAVVPEKDRADMIAYLTKHFGPDNNRFVPIRTRPVGY